MKVALKIPALAIGSIILGMVSTATAQTGGTDKKGGGILSYSLQLGGGMVGRMEGMSNQQASSGQVTFSCTSDMQPPFFDWLKGAIGGSTSKKECSVLEASYDGNVKSVTNMHNTSVTSVTMPALDAESKERCKIKVALNAESAKMAANSGMKVNQPSSGTKRGEWVASSFTVSVSGHNDLFAHVTNVGEITVKPNAGPGGRADVSSLKITCMCKPDELKKLQQWFTDYAKQSTNLNNPPLSIPSVITYMSSDKRSLFTVTYQACPFKVTEQGKPNTAGMQAVVAEFYSKGAKFDYSN